MGHLLPDGRRILKGSVEGKTYIGPGPSPAGADDREVVSFDGQVLILKWVDPAGRYGIMVLARCGSEGAPPTRGVRPKKKLLFPVPPANPLTIDAPPSCTPSAARTSAPIHHRTTGRREGYSGSIKTVSRNVLLSWPQMLTCQSLLPGIMSEGGDLGGREDDESY
jgi:hypothetical protein